MAKHGQTRKDGLHETDPELSAGSEYAGVDDADKLGVGRGCFRAGNGC